MDSQAIKIIIDAEPCSTRAITLHHEEHTTEGMKRCHFSSIWPKSLEAKGICTYFGIQSSAASSSGISRNGSAILHSSDALVGFGVFACLFH